MSYLIEYSEGYLNQEFIPIIYVYEKGFRAAANIFVEKKF